MAGRPSGWEGGKRCSRSRHAKLSRHRPSWSGVITARSEGRPWSAGRPVGRPGWSRRTGWSLERLGRPRWTVTRTLWSFRNVRGSRPEVVRVSDRSASRPEGFELSSRPRVTGSAAVVTRGTGRHAVAGVTRRPAGESGVDGGSAVMSGVTGGPGMARVPLSRKARGSRRVGRPRVPEGAGGGAGPVVRVGRARGSGRSERTRRSGRGRSAEPTLSVSVAAVAAVRVRVMPARVWGRKVAGGVIAHVVEAVGRCRRRAPDLVQQLVGTAVTGRRAPSRGSPVNEDCPY